VEKESTNKLASGSMKRTLLIFIFGGFILNVAVNMIYVICRVIWIDFVHYNPHRSQLNALYLIAQSPIDALILTLYYSLPVIVGAIVAMVSHRIWGRVPFYSLVAMLPLCVFTLYKQMPSRPIPLGYTDILWLFILQLPVVVGCWWWSNRTPKT